MYAADLGEILIKYLLSNSRMFLISNYSFQFTVLPRASVFYKGINHCRLFNASPSFVLFEDVYNTACWTTVSGTTREVLNILKIYQIIMDYPLLQDLTNTGVSKVLR